MRERLQKVQEKIKRACIRAGRDPAEVRLVLVTKNVSVQAMREAFDRGMHDFGENRVQEFLEKKPKLPSEIHWHFVGHLQKNKVKNLVGEITLLHSLDRIDLAVEVQRRAEFRGCTVEALLQVNTTGEAAKSGFSPQEVERVLKELKKFPRIRIRGLMTIGPLAEDTEKIRQSFRTLRLLRDDFGLQELSMGMSSDFQIAIEEGATILRIGTAIFGERGKNDESQIPITNSK